MDAKFPIDFRQYAAIQVECPDCHMKYQLQLRLDHFALCQKVNDKISVHCPDYAKARRTN